MQRLLLLRHVHGIDTANEFIHRLCAELYFLLVALSDVLPKDYDLCILGELPFDRLDIAIGILVLQTVVEEESLLLVVVHVSLHLYLMDVVLAGVECTDVPRDVDAAEQYAVVYHVRHLGMEQSHAHESDGRAESSVELLALRIQELALRSIEVQLRTVQSPGILGGRERHGRFFHLCVF